MAAHVFPRRRQPVLSLATGLTAARNAAAFLRNAPAACARATPLAPEDREIAALLLAPFFILAVAIAGNQSLQLGTHLHALIARPVPPLSLPANPNTTHLAARQPIARPLVTPDPVWSRQPAKPVAAAAPLNGPIPDRTRVSARPPGGALSPLPMTRLQAAETIAPPMAKRALANAARPLEPAPPNAIATATPLMQTTARGPARIMVPDQTGTPQRSAVFIDLTSLANVLAYDENDLSGRRRISLYQRCSLPQTTQPAMAGMHLTSAAGRLAAYKPAAPTGSSGITFGHRLAAAARRQLDEFVVYDAAYRSISYPMGDVPNLYGVCTDVVIRAYRDLGIDLQVAVQKARVGSGDHNIDHRRTETLRRFFQRAGENLPVTSFAEDYQPGDIVTYARPQNTSTASRSHIAIVSDALAPSGRPMIIHNRGWGPQLEDALFVDRITGHYRYSGIPDARTVVTAPPLPATHSRLLQKASLQSPGPASHGRTAAVRTPPAH